MVSATSCVVHAYSLSCTPFDFLGMDPFLGGSRINLLPNNQSLPSWTNSSHVSGEGMSISSVGASCWMTLLEKSHSLSTLKLHNVLGCCRVLRKTKTTDFGAAVEKCRDVDCR